MTADNAVRKPPYFPLALVAGYVGIVLLVDTLAAYGAQTPLDWRLFRWVGPGRFDWFKFIMWLVVPFLFCVRRMDWGYYGVARWRRLDWALLGGLALVSLLAVLAVQVFPSLRAYYPSYRHLHWAQKWEFVRHSLLWVTSWLVGWEFLHRYFLLRPFAARWPRWGWLIVPFSEGVYHLQKAWVEMAAMVAVSAVFTVWALRRKNALLPFLAHLIVEVELILFMVLL